MPRLVELLKQRDKNNLVSAGYLTDERYRTLLKSSNEPAVLIVEYITEETKKEYRMIDRVMREPPGPTYVRVRGRKHVKEGWK
ncbi:MAG: hypothetical protein V1897_19840 [Pseudomonadota bacterium]